MSAEKLPGERMYIDNTTGDFHDMCWFDEATKDQIKNTEEVYVIPTRELRQFALECFRAGSDNSLSQDMPNFVAYAKSRGL